jgi:predicted phage tail protein
MKRNAETIQQDSDEIKRQKKHLAEKAQEYKDQADREKCMVTVVPLMLKAKRLNWLQKILKNLDAAWQRSAGKD